MVHNDASYKFLISSQYFLVDFSIVSDSGLPWDTTLDMYKLKPRDLQYAVDQIFLHSLQSSYKNCHYILRFHVVEKTYD